MTPIPDVIRMNSPNTFVYRSREEFITQVTGLMQRPQTYQIDLDVFSWKRKARQFEAVFDEVIGEHSSKFINAFN
jgi:hypothetical protein